MEFNILNSHLKVDQILNFELRKQEDESQNQEKQVEEFEEEEQIREQERRDRQENIVFFNETKEATIKNGLIEEVKVYGRDARLLIYQEVTVTANKMYENEKSIEKKRKTREEEERGKENEGYITIDINKRQMKEYEEIIESRFEDEGEVELKDNQYRGWYERWGTKRIKRAVAMTCDMQYGKIEGDPLKRRHLLKPPKILRYKNNVLYFSVRSQTNTTNEDVRYVVKVNSQGTKTKCNCPDYKRSKASFLAFEEQLPFKQYTTTDGSTKYAKNKSKMIMCKHVDLCYLYIKLQEAKGGKIVNLLPKTLESKLTNLLRCSVDREGQLLLTKGDNSWISQMKNFTSLELKLYSGTKIVPTIFNSILNSLYKFSITKDDLITILNNCYGWNQIQRAYNIFKKLYYFIIKFDHLFSNSVVNKESLRRISSLVTQYPDSEYTTYVIPSIETASYEYYKSHMSNKNLYYNAHIVSYSKGKNTIHCSCYENKVEKEICEHIICFKLYVEKNYEKFKYSYSSLMSYFRSKNDTRDIRQVSSPFSLLLKENNNSNLFFKTTNIREKRVVQQMKRSEVEKKQVKELRKEVQLSTNYKVDWESKNYALNLKLNKETLKFTIVN